MKQIYPQYVNSSVEEADDILFLKEVIMNPIADMAVNMVLSAIYAFMKAQGLSEEEAKAALAAKVAQVEILAPLPMDI